MERCLRAWLFDESSSREVDEHEVLRTSDRYTEALQSLYFSWKTRGCEYFYYMLDGPMGCEVLFRNNTASSAGDGVTATMSSCNDVLLRHLTESGITFQWLDKERYYTGSSTPPTAASPMNSPSSPRAPKPRRKEQQQAPVIIHGFDAVHLLYDFLLNQRFRPSLEAPTKMPVFPRLLSPSAFAQARLVSARVCGDGEMLAQFRE